jgi:hypothetical protein
MAGTMTAKARCSKLIPAAQAATMRKPDSEALLLTTV